MANRIFHAGNARGARVYDVDRIERLDHVMSVDADTGEVIQAEQPLRLIGDEVATVKTRFRVIYPIYGGCRTAQLFHCYGREE